ncbi:hypothetical protein [Gloeocapsopsis dulcis]|nr:hypothetical protein [Gloeocapsopsis dulcis]WNN87554.1 hypothetical protein P0S91_14605 [Gloeocapsopsis dulcis]
MMIWQVRSHKSSEKSAIALGAEKSAIALVLRRAQSQGIPQ